MFGQPEGGVGKNHDGGHLGAYLADAGKRVVAVGADPQAQPDQQPRHRQVHPDTFLYDVMIGSEGPPVIMNHSRKGLDLLPRRPTLAGAEIEMVGLPARELRLRHALEQVAPRYDFVLIDTPPSLGLLTVNALTAADGVIIPVQCEYLPLEGLTQLMQTIELVRQRLNPQLQVRGLLMTMYDTHTNLSRQVVNDVREHFGAVLFSAIIPRSVKLSEAPSYGEPIVTYAPLSAGAMAYEALCGELLAGEGEQQQGA